jgi:hypothetical protein
MRMRVLPAVLLVATVTACGYTVAGSGIPAGAAGPGDAALGGAAGLSATTGEEALPGAPDTSLGTDGAAGVPGSLGSGDGPAGTSGSGSFGGGGSQSVPGAAGQPGAAPGGGAAPPAGGRAPGVTATTITVGLPYTSNGRAAAAAFGATGEGVGGGDQRRIWDVVLKDINGSGGVLGRKLVPVYHENDATSQEPTASKEQAACADWTQDHKVFWVSSGAGETLVPCLHKAGVAQSSSALTDASTSFYRQFPYYVEAGTLQMDRVAASLPDRLRAQSFFAAWDTVRGAAGAAPVKIGIVSFDDPRTVFAVDKLLVPAFARVVAGRPVVIKIATPQSSAENASAISAIQSATLRFREEGVTHVLPFETQGAGVGTFFAQGAEQQKYYPRYGLTSGNGAQVLVDAGLWPKSQINGALGFGWLPLVDVRNADNPDDGPDSNAARRSCLALMEKAGINASSAIIKGQALESCNTLRLLKAAVEAGGPVFTRESFLAGVHRLGSSFQAGTTFATRYDPSHHDGVAQVRPFAYMPACGCIRYSGPRVTVA